MTKIPRRAAVIGAGLCGLTCARDLAAMGWSVEVFEKSRGMGGRLSAKRIPEVGTVDLGAQFFTASTPEFMELINTAAEQNHIAQWQGSIAYKTDSACKLAKEQVRWVGSPSMNAWLTELWPRESIHLIDRIETIHRQPNGHWVLNHRDTDPFAAIILAMPPAQAATLAAGTSLEAPLRSIVMTPCWSGLALFATALDVDFDAAFIRGGDLNWIANNASKPQRTEHPGAWTIHAGAEFSEYLSSLEKDKVANELMAALDTALGGSLPAGQMALTHFWRYASPLVGAAPGVFWDPAIGLGAGGDWAIGGRVEGAFIAGRELAATISRW